MHIHPTDLELEEQRGAATESEVARHVAQCQVCQQRFEQLERLARRMEMAPRVEVPDAIEQAMLQRTQHHARRVRRAAQQERRRPVYVRTWHWAAPLAAAASVALWVGLTRPARLTPDARPAATQGNASADLNHDGQVNIVDAMLLARVLEQGAALNTAWDVDGDARVDRRDVEAIARRAVAIEGL